MKNQRDFSGIAGNIVTLGGKSFMVATSAKHLAVPRQNHRADFRVIVTAVCCIKEFACHLRYECITFVGAVATDQPNTIFDFKVD